MKDGLFQTEFSPEPVYKIQSVRRQDSGVYQCVARNAVGSIFSDQIKVLVACKNSLSKKFKEIHFQNTHTHTQCECGVCSSLNNFNDNDN